MCSTTQLQEVYQGVLYFLNIKRFTVRASIGFRSHKSVKYPLPCAELYVAVHIQTKCDYTTFLSIILMLSTPLCYNYKVYKNFTKTDQSNTTILFIFQRGDMFRLSQSHPQASINLLAPKFYFAHPVYKMQKYRTKKGKIMK
jgi:hypothetical protein